MSYIVEIYKANYQTGEYTRLAEVITWERLRFNSIYNKVQYGQVKMNIADPATRSITPYQNWILVKRNGVAEYFGNIINVYGSVSGVRGEIVVELADMFYRLERVFSDLKFIRRGVDASVIATNIIDEIQSRSNANFGIQNGTIQNVGVSNETLFNQSLGGAIINQSDNIRGYYARFVPRLNSNGKVDAVIFNVYNTIGVIRSNLSPIEIGLQTNGVQFGMNTELYNKVYVQGQGTGEDVPIAEQQTQVSQEVHGLIEKVIKRPLIAIRSTLQSNADEAINENSGIQLEVGFTLNPAAKPYYGDFGLMDTINLNIEIPNTFFNFTGRGRILELDFNVEDNVESISPIIEYYKS